MATRQRTAAQSSTTPALRFTERVEYHAFDLVARIHRRDKPKLPKTGTKTVAEWLPKLPNKTEDHVQCRKRSMKMLGETPLLVMGNTPKEEIKNLLEWRDGIRQEHLGSWIQVISGDALPVGPLPVTLVSVLDKAQAAYRAHIAELTKGTTPPSKGDREIESATLAEVLNALLPAPTTLAVDINRDQDDPHSGLRLKVARLMAGYSTRQFGRAVKIIPLKGKKTEREISERQLRSFESGIDGEPEAGVPKARLPDLARVLFPDAFTNADSRQSKLAGTSHPAPVASMGRSQANPRSQAQEKPFIPFTLDGPGVPQKDPPSSQDCAIAWLTHGGFAWWWTEAEGLPAKRPAKGLPGPIGLPCWSGTLLRPFVTWLHGQLTSEQRTLVAQRQVVPEVTTDGMVVLRRFQLFKVRPIMAVQEVPMMPASTQRKP